MTAMNHRQQWARLLERFRYTGSLKIAEIARRAMRYHAMRYAMARGWQQDTSKYTPVRNVSIKRFTVDAAREAASMQERVNEIRAHWSVFRKALKTPGGTRAQYAKARIYKRRAVESYAKARGWIETTVTHVLTFGAHKKKG